MRRMPLVATKDFSFKGRTYAPGDRFELPVGDAYKVVSRKQAKRAKASVGVDIAAGSDTAVEYPPDNLTAPTPEPEPVVEEQPAPEATTEQPAEEDKPRRRRRRQSSYEADAVPHEPSEPEWNSE